MQKPIVALLAALLAFGCSASDVAPRPASGAPEGTVPHHGKQVFDFDDNIAFLDTRIILFKKSSGEEYAMPSGEFALVDPDEVGKPGTPWADYEMRFDRTTGSYRNFGDVRVPTVFADDIRKAVASGKPWKGPMFDEFVEAMESSESAMQTVILTARGHEPQNMKKALEFLRAEGYIAHVVPVENYFPVNNPELKSRLGGESTAKNKALVLTGILDALNASALPANAPPVLDPDGTARRPMHQLDFSDDDYKNIAATIDALAPLIAEQRWPNVKILLHYTGHNREDQQARSMVFRGDGSTRPCEEGETPVTLDPPDGLPH